MTGDHHCGASLSGMSKTREPGELWCIVESVTAAIANIRRSFRRRHLAVLTDVPRGIAL